MNESFWDAQGVEIEECRFLDFVASELTPGFESASELTPGFESPAHNPCIMSPAVPRPQPEHAEATVSIIPESRAQ